MPVAVIVSDQNINYDLFQRSFVIAGGGSVTLGGFFYSWQLHKSTILPTSD